MSLPGRPKGAGRRGPHDAGPAAAAGPEVRCPVCQRPALFAPANPWRPFCSERCRGIDFGAWASEGYRVAAEPPVDDTGSEPPTH